MVPLLRLCSPHCWVQWHTIDPGGGHWCTIDLGRVQWRTIDPGGGHWCTIDLGRVQWRTIDPGGATGVLLTRGGSTGVLLTRTGATGVLLTRGWSSGVLLTRTRATGVLLTRTGPLVYYWPGRCPATIYARWRYAWRVRRRQRSRYSLKSLGFNFHIYLTGLYVCCARWIHISWRTSRELYCNCHRYFDEWFYCLL